MSNVAPVMDLSRYHNALVSFVDEGRGQVFCIQPKVPGTQAVHWASENRGVLDEALFLHGAVLLRDFAVDGVEGFTEAIKATSNDWASYREPATPRTQVADNIFTSTDYPQDRIIPLHNENSHCTSWPLKIYFHCVTPARSGGQTPIADCRRVLSRLHQEVIDEFSARDWLYIRNFGNELGFPWRKVFRTLSKPEVEAYCRANEMLPEWGPDETLKVRYVRPAVRPHPVTGEPVWFNHGLFFNMISIEESIREMLLESYSADELPYNTFYGDGQPVPAAILDAIGEAYRKETRYFSWQAGDILIADNMLVAHGRASFEGSRKILVGMANSHCA